MEDLIKISSLPCTVVPQQMKAIVPNCVICTSKHGYTKGWMMLSPLACKMHTDRNTGEMWVISRGISVQRFRGILIQNILKKTKNKTNEINHNEAV